MTPKFAVGSDGNYIVIGNKVRHSSDDLAIRNGESPGTLGTVEKLSLRYENSGYAEVWAFVRWPLVENPNGWPVKKGGGAIEARANTFRKVTPEELMAEEFMKT